jgi:tetratricopeptide (TPR) repeat protein
MSDFQEGNRKFVAKDYEAAIRLFLCHAAACPNEAGQAYARAAECCLRSNIIAAPVPTAPGVNLVSRGDRRGAEYYFRLAIQADPNNVAALFGLAEILPDGSAERHDLLERSVATQPGTLNLVALGDYYRSVAKDPDRAYALYQQAQSHAPRDQTAYLRLNDICRKMGHPDEAKDWSRRWKEVSDRKRSVDGGNGAET